METAILFAVILHFDFNGRDVSVLPEGARAAYASDALCKPHARTERIRWRNMPQFKRADCERFEVRR